MIKLAQDVDLELRTNVIQAEKKEEGVYGQWEHEHYINTRSKLKFGIYYLQN